MKQALLAQERKKVKAQIDESPEVVIIYRQSTTSDGFGGTVPNPFGTETPYTIKCRLSHELKQAPDYNTQPPGLSTNLARFMLVDYQTDIREGDTFDAIGKQWRVGVIDQLKRYGGIIGYQAPLLEAVINQEES